jgi:hypothetical protein
MKSPIVLSLAALSLAACGGGDAPPAPTPQLAMSTTVKIESGKGGGGGGGGAPAPAPAPSPTPAPAPAPAPSPSPSPTTPAPAPGTGPRLPPAMTTDGPAWAFTNISGVTTTGFTPDIDFGRLQNMTPGGIAVGATRSASELVYNTSKKTPLTVTQIQVTGANPADFLVSAQAIASAATTVLPANKDAAEALQITFRPTAAGARTANVVFTSVAGVVQIVVTGTGLPTRPILSGLEPVAFLPESAPVAFIVQNTGGATLALNTIAIVGAKPAAFELTVANAGQGNCFAGVLLAPLSYCFLGVGLAPGAAAPATATLAVTSNDPANPTMSVPLTLTAAP